ncbi:MAG: lamin tail domain-containing protein, partial [Candidatus Methanomethylophilaceae archaeon]|nr:lamin tail domain-containing protein [Candidatus Methanomethylophilaceae archaeon]
MRRNDKRGAMPFAVVAVAILLASAACGAIVADYERAAQESRSGEKDAEAVDAAIGSMRGFVNRGLAEIIRDVSLSDGNVEDRLGSFDKRAETWLRNQFPMTEDGVRAELVSHDVSLEAESLRLVSSEEAPSGYVPAYLKAVGTVSVKVQTNTGSAETDLDVSTDGSCVLPLAAEQGSLFERMAGEGSVSLSEIMSYQLSGLAQLRVLNGYGAASARGPMGTDRIVTKDDVLKAYDEALALLSMICFRDGDGRMGSAERADPATILASEDGKITIDLQAAYAQVLMSLLDDMALKWFDYLPGNGLSKNLQSRLLPYRTCSGALTAFLKGEEAFSAAPYLKEMMELNGVPEDVYRYPGSGTTALSALGTTVEVENPCADVLGTSWIRHFRSDYDVRENWVVDYARNVLRAAVLKVGDRTGLGSVTVEVDPYSGEKMAETVSAAVDGALKGLHERFQESVAAALAESCAADPFYSAICEGIANRRESYVLEEEFEERAREALTAALAPDAAEKAMSEGYADALEAYREKVYADLEVFDELEKVPGGQNVFVRMIMSEICAFGMEASGIASLAGARMSSVCKEMCDVYGMNPYGGPVDLPGSSAFQVEREGGGVSFETLKASISSSPTVSGPFLDEDSCIRSIGFGEGVSAAYSATYRVSIEDEVSYGLKGYGSMSSAMGTPSCSVSGSFRVSVSFDVRVVSGWSLQGIDYKPSCTFMDDVKDSALEALEPVLEPLRKFMEVMGVVMTAVGERIADAARMVAEYVRILYDDLIVPLTEICEWAKTKLDEFACQLTESFLIKIGLKDQSVSMKLYGYDLTITSDLVSLTGKTKTLFSLELSKEVDGRKVSAGVTLKTKGGLNADDIRFVGFGSIKDPGDKGAGRDPWSVKVRLDPFMKSGKHLLTVDGRAGKTSVSLVLPEMVQYHELGLRLSDVPGLGAALSNIPLPLVGAKASLDAGFSLKYDAPMKRGLVINEFETNPAGDDRSGEWVELFNNSESTVELDGYTLTASSDWRSKIMPLSGSIAPGEFMEIEPDFVMVNSSG